MCEDNENANFLDKNLSRAERFQICFFFLRTFASFVQIDTHAHRRTYFLDLDISREMIGLLFVAEV